MGSERWGFKLFSGIFYLLEHLPAAREGRNPDCKQETRQVKHERNVRLDNKHTQPSVRYLCKGHDEGEREL